MSAQFRGRGVQTPRAGLPPRSQGKRVVGIDLATTRCCVASAGALWEQLKHLHDTKVQPPDVEIYSRWEGAYETLQTNPLTALYFEKPGQLPITGNALGPILKARRKQGEASFNTNHFFRLWKLMFHDDQNDPATKDIQAEIQQKLDRLGMTKDDLLRGWVAVIYDELFVKGLDGQPKLRHWDNRPMDLEIVVAVPPGRSVIAHEQVLQAFVQGPIRAHQVSLVSEPEGLFRSWLAAGVHTQDWKVGQIYLVGDGGGGTCCLVRFRLDQLNPLHFTQEFESESIVCGAETISNNFERLAATMVPLDIPNRPSMLDILRRHFDEAYKLHFGSVAYRGREYPIVKPWDHDSEMVFSWEQIAACFDPCVSKLIAGIHRQLQRGDLGPLGTDGNSAPMKYLVLGGGLFSNPYVMSRIRTEFPFLEIRELSTDKAHVARGAVLTRLYARNDFISSRPILRSKALLTQIPVDDSIRRSPLYSLLDTRLDKRNGTEYFWAAKWLIKQGDEAKLNHANDIYEVASESSFETARVRAFSLKARNLQFSETILTVNYHPGEATWAALRKGDNRLIDQNGNLIPNYEESEKITWDPQKSGVSIGGLEVKGRDKGRYRVLRYCLQMQLREVGTKYWVKAWSLDNKSRQRVKAVVSEATERQALFQPQEISQNLSESRKLGSGICSEVDANDDLSMESQGLEFLFSRPSPHAASSPMAQKQQVGNVQPSSPATGIQQPMPTPVPENLWRKSLPTASSTTIQVNPRKRSVSTEGASQPFREFSRSPLSIRPTQGQSAESNGEYSLGAPRNNGGCWTCAFRNLKCEQGKPSCPQCSKVGIVCEYGRPKWWYADMLKEKQREINKDLIKNHKYPRSFKKGLRAPASTSRNKIAANPSKSRHQNANPGKQTLTSEVDAQRSRSFQPPMTVNSTASRAPPSFPKAYDELTTPEIRLELDASQDQDDLYGGSPPPRRSARPRQHFIPADMKWWADVEDEEVGEGSEFESPAEESNEEY